MLRSALWKAKLALTGNVVRNVELLRTWENLSQEESEALQRDRLRALLAHARDHVPYYRELIHDHNVLGGDGDIRLDAFSTLPLLTKEILRSRGDSLRSDDLAKRKWQYNTSGGSTGEPVRFIQDQDTHDWKVAVKEFFNSWSGYTPGSPRVLLWGSERDLFVGKESARVRFGRWLRNEVWLNAFRMTPEDVRTHVQVINRFQPVQILAYVESIHELARHIEREGLEVHSPRAIMTSAGTLHDPVRELVERVFETRVFNRYGSREVGDMACEDDHHHGLVVSAPTHYIEILRADGSPADPGEVGEVVVTLLTNFAMPIIRYRIGDLAAWQDEGLTSTRAWPVLESVKGRVTDTFTTGEGARVHGEYFAHLMYFRDWVEKFQFVQEDVGRVTVRVQPRRGAGDVERKRRSELDDIAEKVQVVMGDTCVVEFRFEDEIDPSDSGKFRYTRSSVTPSSGSES